MKRLHVVPSLDVIGNGMSVAARLIANANGDDLINSHSFVKGAGDIMAYKEVWIHSCWLPLVLMSCRRVLKAGKPLVCMPHGNLDPVRLHYHEWKKWLVGPFERRALRNATKIVATCETEAEWIRAYEPKVKLVETVDLKQFFKLPTEPIKPYTAHNFLYLGRDHPLKGLEYLKEAIADSSKANLRILSHAFGYELEESWRWADALVLPTISENFGLVVAEALEKKKYAITTDGAPIWGDGNSYGGRLVYLRGYRDGSHAERVAMLKDAILSLTTSR